MRDYAKILYISVGVAALLLVVIFIPAPMEISKFLFMGLLVLPMLFLSMWSMEVMKRLSPQLSGFGFHASLLQLEPIDSVKITDPSTKKEYEWVLFLHGGIKLFGTKGGGVHGCSVVRKDLIVTLGGDQSNVWIFSVGIPHQMDRRPGDPYHDLSELPLEIYKMVQRHAFDPRGHVLYWRDPVESPEALRDLDQMNYKNLYAAANQQIKNLTETNDNLTQKMTRMSETMLATSDAGFGRRRDYRDRDRPTSRFTEGWGRDNRDDYGRDEGRR